MRAMIAIAAAAVCLAPAGPAAWTWAGGDEGCADGACGVAYYRDDALCEPVPLPRRPGPHRCVAKPEVKEVKKTVYEAKWVPYCLPSPQCGSCRKGDCKKPCPACEKCVRWKKVVVKREVVVDRVCVYECVPQPCGRACATGPHEAPPAPADVPPAPPAKP